MDALAANIARLADSCAGDIRAALVAQANCGHTVPHLTSACSALDALQRSAVQLRASLAATSSETLKAGMAQSLEACSTRAASLFKQVARLDSESVLRTRERFWTVLGVFVGAHVKLFSCYVDILCLPTANHQDERLSASASQEVLHQAAHAVRLAADAPDIFAEESSHANLPHCGKEIDVPPPYEPSLALPPSVGILRRASHDSEAGGSGTARSRAWAKITSPVKAFRGHMGSGVVLPYVDDLCAAAADGQAKHVEALLAQGAAVDGISATNDTALGLAAEHNHMDVAKALLQADAQACFHSPHQMPPVFVAAAGGHKDLALLLLEHGASVTAKDMRGQPFLIQLVEEGNHAAMQFLLQHGANANATDATTGRTPIVHAVATNDVSMATVLLAFGADPNARDVTGRPILVQAVENQNGALVRFLLDSGADSNASDITGASVLAVACRKHVKTSETVPLLLRRGARVDSKTVVGTTVLADALGRHRVDLARLLLAHGADAGAAEVTGQPLVVAVVRSKKMVLEDKMELLRMMLQRGASVRARDFVTRETVVEVARKVEGKKVVRLLESFEAGE